MESQPTSSLRAGSAGVLPSIQPGTISPREAYTGIIQAAEAGIDGQMEALLQTVEDAKLQIRRQLATLGGGTSVRSGTPSHQPHLDHPLPILLASSHSAPIRVLLECSIPAGQLQPYECSGLLTHMSILPPAAARVQLVRQLMLPRRWPPKQPPKR